MRRRLALAVAAAVVVAIVAPVPAGAAPPARPRQSQGLGWVPCDGGGECAELTVPLDYKRPRKGGTAAVALYRMVARQPDQRIGSLLVNPGGPGASGVAFARAIYDDLPDELKDRFDIVGFDPRGTGGTLPVDCGDVLDRTFGLDYSPDSREEHETLVAETGAVVRQCAAENRSILRHISSMSTVRDMDRIRRALGDAQLTYLGYSYGTYLGAVDADQFPRRVRALLLDGAVDPQLSPHDAALQQAVGFEQSLDAFLAECSADPRCDFHNGGDAGGAFDRLAQSVDATPLAGSDGRELGPGLFGIAVIKALYDGPAIYEDFGAALAAAVDGDPDDLLGFADDYTRRDDPATENALEAFWAIGCRDGPGLGTPDELDDLEAEFAAAAPRVGVSGLYLGLMCAHWPVRPVSIDAPKGKGAAPILVIGTEGDPATPVQWAQALAEQLESGVLLTTSGGRHATFVLGGIPCVDDYGVRYLVDLVVPPDGARCGSPV